MSKGTNPPTRAGGRVAPCLVFDLPAAAHHSGLHVTPIHLHPQMRHAKEEDTACVSPLHVAAQLWEPKVEWPSDTNNQHPETNGNWEWGDAEEGKGKG